LARGRLTLLVASPRVAPGLLSRSAWQALDAAASVLGRDADEPLVDAIHDAGMPVTHLGLVPAPQLARTLVDRAGEADIVWVSSADGDPGLTDAVAAEVTRLPDPPEVEVLVGSWDVPGSRLLDLVAVMDRLRSPGGCPWDAEQTHESLVKYLLEEAHEAVEAIESGDRAHIREELGDVLLQVAFQSRVGEEHPEEPFDIDDVAAQIKQRHSKGRYASIVVVAEGAVPEEGTLSVASGRLDAFDHAQLGGIGQLVAAALEERTGYETRATVLGHIQRGGTPTAYDRVLATRFGLRAIGAVHEQAFGTMVALKGDVIDLVPLGEAVTENRTVGPDFRDETAVFSGQRRPEPLEV
jgi:NTP pyrophosphatase (non-canonical NTP hydrolase)